MVEYEETGVSTRYSSYRTGTTSWAYIHLRHEESCKLSALRFKMRGRKCDVILPCSRRRGSVQVMKSLILLVVR